MPLTVSLALPIATAAPGHRQNARIGDSPTGIARVPVEIVVDRDSCEIAEVAIIRELHDRGSVYPIDLLIFVVDPPEINVELRLLATMMMTVGIDGKKSSSAWWNSHPFSVPATTFKARL